MGEYTMIRMSRRTAALAMILSAALPAVASAQDQTRLGAFKYWSAFQAGSGQNTTCWAATAPISTDFSGGKRGDVFLMVTMRPATGVEGEVSMISGYPYDESRTVQAVIKSSNFSFFTSEDGAWLETRREEGQMVAAMKAGAKATFTGFANSGGKSVDSFSLLGFTNAYNAARKACGF